MYLKITGKRTVAEVIELYGADSRSRLQPLFEVAGVAYPPKELTFLAMKDSNQMELWASDGERWHKISNYDIKGASGGPGPKLREGDKQVPEGIYRVTGLNPNSAYHLSMKLNYPNSFDLKWAKLENRNEPGSNIFIHGKSLSIGCLAMGDEVIEDLFVLSNDVGIANIQVIIAPADPRMNKLLLPDGANPWVQDLYHDIETAVTPFSS
ncbi:L,D-transpeptidase family protein [Hahella ganghwensis]|uniref:L,D-transpeptidase family protein n=1 Tax=Hahella ganghwensis TaxID=286420 RepID=UPI00039D3DEA|nr:L,D-transpeptidase family protein [Hahella ganghwensis]